MIVTVSGVSKHSGYSVVKVNIVVAVAVGVAPLLVVKVPVIVTVNSAAYSTVALYHVTIRSAGVGNVIKLLATFPGLLSNVDVMAIE